MGRENDLIVTIIASTPSRSVKRYATCSAFRPSSVARLTRARRRAAANELASFGRRRQLELAAPKVAGEASRARLTAIPPQWVAMASARRLCKSQPLVLAAFGSPFASQEDAIMSRLGNFSSRTPEDGRSRRRRARRLASARASRAFAAGSDGRHRLCRRARRFRLEPGPCGRDQGAEEGAGRQGRRGRERARDRRGARSRWNR